MTVGEAQLPAATLAELVDELQRRGAGRPVEIARRLRPDWTPDSVLAALVALFCEGVIGYSPEVGLWWIA